MTSTTTIQAQCCVAGAGPAGMMLGLLLARAGVDVVVLEKHADFLRDFRGDTIHPSTLDVMSELGVLETFLQQPHQRVTRLAGKVGDATVTVADFTRLRSRCRFLAFMPQWEFLNFLAGQAARYPNFRLKMSAAVEDVLLDGDRIVGVRAATPEGPIEVHAALTVAADGRGSVVRDRAGLDVIDVGAPMDVLWLRVSKRDDDPHDTFGYVRNGRILALIDRGEYWQSAYVIPKGTMAGLHERGLQAFRDEIGETVPFLSDRLGEIATWDDVRLLTVRVDRLRRWYRRGLLCLGDAAHAMSPIGGVGINLAIQDAVAAANMLAGELLEGAVSLRTLRRIQRRREFAARVTQALQVMVGRHVIGRVLNTGSSPVLRAVPKLVERLPFLTRIPARLVGLGIRPEHVARPKVRRSPLF
jgi:2-polyprenyl-6-methoxyphenol hydroxylase-like FAD-dependent oxidoreductase